MESSKLELRKVFLSGFMRFMWEWLGFGQQKRPELLFSTDSIELDLNIEHKHHTHSHNKAISKGLYRQCDIFWEIPLMNNLKSSLSSLEEYCL